MANVLLSCREINKVKYVKLFKLTSSRCHRPRSSILCSWTCSRGRHFLPFEWSCPRGRLGWFCCAACRTRRSSTRTIAWRSSWTTESNRREDRKLGSPDRFSHEKRYNRGHACWKGKRRVSLYIIPGNGNVRSSDTYTTTLTVLMFVCAEYSKKYVDKKHMKVRPAKTLMV